MTKLTPAQSKAVAKIAAACAAQGGPVHADDAGVSRTMALRLWRAGILAEHPRTIQTPGGRRWVRDSFWTVADAPR